MKKPFLRAGRDRTQVTRRLFQAAFLALNAWIAVEFYRFVRYYESAGQIGSPTRPPGVEGWLPIASLMNLKVLLYTGGFPRIHPAGVFLLIAFLLISWLLRKSFCSWLCGLHELRSRVPGGERCTCRWKAAGGVPLWVMAGGIAAIFFGCVAVAQWTGHWDAQLPERVYREMVPKANEYEHP